MPPQFLRSGDGDLHKGYAPSECNPTTPTTEPRSSSMTGINSARVAIVTGAGQGIGRAIAHRLARDGFRLALADVSGNAKALDGVVAEVGKFGTKAISLPCDVRKKEDVDGLVAETAKQLGQVNGR